MLVCTIFPAFRPSLTTPAEKSAFVPNVCAVPVLNTIPEPSPKIIPFDVYWWNEVPVNSCAPEKYVPAGNV